MGLREQSIRGCVPEFVFKFSVTQVLVGLRKQFINNFVFATLACAAGFNNNNNNNIAVVFQLSDLHGSNANVRHTPYNKMVLAIPVLVQ